MAGPVGILLFWTTFSWESLVKDQSRGATLCDQVPNHIMVGEDYTEELWNIAAYQLTDPAERSGYLHGGHVFIAGVIE